MILHPTLEEARNLASKGNICPLFTELPADLETPVSAYLKIARGDFSYLLESVEGGERMARYSFIGTEPYRTFRSGAPGSDSFEDPLLTVEQELAAFKPVSIPGLPRFTGGAVGYMGYEIVRYFEPRVPQAQNDALGLPEAIFMFTDTLLVFDHVQHRIKVVSHFRLDGDIDVAYRDAVSRIDELVARLEKPLAPLPYKAPARIPSAEERVISSNLSREDHRGMVLKAKEYIVAGDIIQIVLSQRFQRPTAVHAFDVYRSLRTINPSPYMYYLDFGEIQVVGTSRSWPVTWETRCMTWE